MGQWAVSVLGPEPLHLEVTLTSRVRAPRHHQEVPGSLQRAARSRPTPHRRRIPCPANSPEALTKRQRIG